MPRRPPRSPLFPYTTLSEPFLRRRRVALLVQAVGDRTLPRGGEVLANDTLGHAPADLDLRWLGKRPFDQTVIHEGQPGFDSVRHAYRVPVLKEARQNPG